ncbi:MAG: hypothetical protein AAFY34_05820 [Pseudomonadota bacterium]
MDETAFSKLTMEERKGVMRLAELRVRGGEAPISVRCSIGIPEATFMRAAARGLWRQKDLQREVEGLDPLPLAYYARPNCGRTHGSAEVGEEADPADTGLQDLANLLDAAESCGAQALKYFHSGHRAKAEEKLKEAERLARLHRRLSVHMPPQPTPAELEQQRIDAMSNEELIEEIKRRAGLV